MKYTGVVHRIGSKQFGERTTYYFFLKGVEGLFKLNARRPTFKEGAEISFETDDKLNVNWSTVSAGVAAPAVTAPAAAPAANLASATKFPVAFDKYRNREYVDLERRNINRQFSYRLAVDLVEKLLAAGAISFTNSKGAPIGAAKAYDAFMAHVEELTDRIYRDVAADHKDLTPPPAAAPAPAPAPAAAEPVAELED